MRVYVQKVILEPIEIKEGELITQTEAAEVLQITSAGVRSAMDAGRLPTYFVDSFHGRMTLREVVERMAREKEKNF